MANKDKQVYNEYMREYMLNRYHERRKEALVHLGGKCVECGSISDLEIDHIDPLDKSFSVSRLWSCSKEKFWQEIDKCQLLCNFHHVEKTKTDIRVIRTGETELKHGTQWKYKKEGCRCEPCCLANTVANKKYKQASVTQSG